MAAGLRHVLSSAATFFTQKRLCVMGIPGGHVTLCHNRVKVVIKNDVTETSLPDEGAWRAALRARFGVAL